MRARIGKYTGPDQANSVVSKLTVADNVAPAFGVIPNMLLKMQVKCNNKTIESIDENIAQVEAMCVRQKMSGEWKRGLGQDLNFWHPDFNERVQVISSDGLTYDSTKNVQLLEGAAATSGQLADYLDYATPNRVQFVVGGAGAGIIRFQANNGAANGVGFINLRDFLAVGDMIYFNDGGEKQGTVVNITESLIQVF